MVTEAMVQAPNARELIDLLSSFKSGVTSEGIAVKLDRLQVSATVHQMCYIHVYIEVLLLDLIGFRRTS